MIDTKKNTTTEELVKGPAPITEATAPEAEKPSSENKTPASTTAPAPSLTTSSTTATGQAIQNSLNRTTLPEGYLADGSMVDADGALFPEYIGEYAEKSAKALKGLPASTFYSAFLREAKALRKKKTPYGAQKNCAMGMVTQAKKLAHRKKDPAPGVLVEMIQAATATVTDPGTFEALYMHLDAIYSYMLE